MATACIVPTNEKAHCFRLLSLVIDGGTMVLRHQFDQRIPPTDLQSKLCEPNIKGKLRTLKKKNTVITQDQWTLLYGMGGQPTSAAFDITLLACLLRYICGLDEQSQWWSCIPPSFEVSVEADVSRLRLLRNEMAHLKSVSLTTLQFEDKWKEMEQVIMRLGCGIQHLKQNLQKLKYDSIDPDKERDYQKILMEWKDMDDSLQLDVDEMKFKLQETVEDIDKVKERSETDRLQSVEVRHEVYMHEAKIETLETTQHEETMRINTLSINSHSHEEAIVRIESKQAKLEQEKHSEEKSIPDAFEFLHAAVIDDQIRQIDMNVFFAMMMLKKRKAHELDSLLSMTNLYLEDKTCDQLYVSTNAHKGAMDKFSQSRCVVLSGLPGEGKTSMAVKLISEMTMPGRCLKLRQPSDWKVVDFNNVNFNTIFIDDIFGTGALDETLLQEWSRLLPDIENAIRRRGIRVIITTRHFILEEAKESMQHLNLFKDENIQILASFDLTDSERANMLEVHLKHANKEFGPGFIEECNMSYSKTFGNRGYEVPKEMGEYLQVGEKKRINAMIGFPEIVELFVNNEHLFKKGTSFFKSPITFFKKCMEELFPYERKFLALIMIWSMPKKCLKLVDLEEPPGISGQTKHTAKKFGFKLKQKTVAVLRKSLKYHQDGFLRFDPRTGTYTFCHNIVKDMVGLVAGKDYTNAVLEYADEQFVMQYITTDKGKQDGFHIFVEEFRHKQLHKTICNILYRSVSQHMAKHRDVQIENCFGFMNSEPSEMEQTVNTSVLRHDCFSNAIYVQMFVESEEGKHTLSQPVEMLPRHVLYYDIELEKNLPVYLPSLALLYGRALLLEEYIYRRFDRKSADAATFLYTTLLFASHQGMDNIIELLLRHGATVNDTAIFIAARKGHADCLNILLTNRSVNYNSDVKSRHKNSPLIAAVKIGSISSIQCLIRHGADVNYRNKNNWSALDKAVLYRQSEACRILLENKAVANCKTGKFKRTPLHMNADTGDERITELLLQYGASIYSKDYRGHYPIHCAAFQSNNKIVNILLKSDTSRNTLKRRVSYGKHSDIKGADLFHIAVMKHNAELIDILLQNNVCPNVRDFYGRTPFYRAIFELRWMTSLEARRLVKPHRKIDFHMQFYDSTEEIIKKLLGVADVRLAERNGYTPLHAAIHKQKVGIAILICPFADINARDKYGKTALHTACEKNDIFLFRILVEEYKADLRILTKKGLSVFDILDIKNNKSWPYCKKAGTHVGVNPLLEPYMEIVANTDPDFAENWIQITALNLLFKSS